jgi:GNAT superfamily N-acetyltransferase
MFETMDTYDRWLEHLKAVSRKETVPNDWVISSTFFAVREHDGRIVGMLNIRHELNDFLRDYGGNIGYGVRPSERRKGYATRILQMALDYCRELGLLRLWFPAIKKILPHERQFSNAVVCLSANSRTPTGRKSRCSGSRCKTAVSLISSPQVDQNHSPMTSAMPAAIFKVITSPRKNQEKSAICTSMVLLIRLASKAVNRFKAIFHTVRRL